MAHAIVRILHRDAGPAGELLECHLSAARRALAESQAAAFSSVGADDVAIEPCAPGEAVIDARATVDRGRLGMVLLGSGSIPLATRADLARFVAAAADPTGPVLVNNFYSGDVIAIPSVADLPVPPDLPGDNALPRWLAERAGRRVMDLRGTWRLQVDLDSPLDLMLLDAARRTPPTLRSSPPLRLESPVTRTLAAVRAVLSDRRAEVVVSGRVSTIALRWFERATASRTRVLIEERGLRAASRLAQGDDEEIGRRASRPPRSLLEMAFDREGPGSLGRILADLGDAALVDSRVLLASRLGSDERSWPSAEDRYASDLLLPDRVRDPWLRDLTLSAVQAPIPILLGGHSLVGPGLRLVASRLLAAARAGNP